MKCRCVECGFLGARLIADYSIVESQPEQRESLEHPSNEQAKVWDIPICTAMEEDFGCGTGSPGISEAVRDPLLANLKRERDCESFITWHRGLSPQEHLKMNMLKEQREFHAASLKSQLELQGKIAKLGRVNAYVCAMIGIGATVVGAALPYLFARLP